MSAGIYTTASPLQRNGLFPSRHSSSVTQLRHYPLCPLLVPEPAGSGFECQPGPVPMSWVSAPPVRRGFVPRCSFLLFQPRWQQHPRW
uniref:Uncharacterized protein n=1 Tax=Falco tinnunculus TaxID=100819 RepID=A0A8C4TY33_FALTI